MGLSFLTALASTCGARPETPTNFITAVDPRIYDGGAKRTYTSTCACVTTRSKGQPQERGGERRARDPIVLYSTVDDATRMTFT